MKKLIQGTTADVSLASSQRGHFVFFNTESEVVGLAADTGVLKEVGEREGICIIIVPMHSEISLVSDFKCPIKPIIFISL